MGYKRTIMDDAKDELFAHMQRCQVPGATEQDVHEWMNDTRQFLADRYPQLTEAQLASLEMIGRRYAKPAIPHGRKATARNRDDWQGGADNAHPDAASDTSEPTGVATGDESAEATAESDESSDVASEPNEGTDENEAGGSETGGSETGGSESELQTA